MPPDEPNEEEELEELPEDGQTPFRPANDQRTDPNDQNLDREIEDSHPDDTRPDFDTDVDKTEIYQDGLSADEPNAGNTVEGYDPDKDRRLKKL
jgi:hypothetical protein